MGWWWDILCAMSSDVVARYFVNNHGGELLISCVRRRRSKLRGCIVLQLLHPFIQMAMLHVPDIDLYMGKVAFKHERSVFNLDPH